MASGVEVLVAGGDRADGVAASFRVRDRKAGTDTAAPLKGKIGLKRLSRKAKNPLSAIATTLDGRRESVRAGLPRRRLPR
ncbi:MAG: hypothetical protein EXQ70_09930 [Solirubrobacterales bacterium]|nr:hypothetical protein [Solirubrobacterales bacterium]